MPCRRQGIFFCARQLKQVAGLASSYSRHSRESGNPFAWQNIRTLVARMKRSGIQGWSYRFQSGTKLSQRRRERRENTGGLATQKTQKKRLRAWLHFEKHSGSHSRKGARLAKDLLMDQPSPVPAPSATLREHKAFNLWPGSFAGCPVCITGRFCLATSACAAGAFSCP